MNFGKTILMRTRPPEKLFSMRIGLLHIRRSRSVTSIFHLPPNRIKFETLTFIKNIFPQTFLMSDNLPFYLSLSTLSLPFYLLHLPCSVSLYLSLSLSLSLSLFLSLSLSIYLSISLTISFYLFTLSASLSSPTPFIAFYLSFLSFPLSFSHVQSHSYGRHT